MTDDVTNAVAHRAAVVEQQGIDQYGDAWKAAVKALEQKVADGTVTQQEIVQDLGRPDAAARIFNRNIGDVDGPSWRAWRDNQPLRKERIRRAGR